MHGLSESGDALFQKYQHFLKTILKLIVTGSDMSFYYMKKEEEETPQGAIAVYVDDTLATGNSEFKKITEKIPKTFESNRNNSHHSYFQESTSTKQRQDTSSNRNITLRKLNN